MESVFQSVTSGAKWSCPVSGRKVAIPESGSPWEGMSFWQPRTIWFRHTQSGTSTRLIPSLLLALVGGFWHTLLINSAHGCRAHRRRRGYLPPAYPRAGSPVRPARAAQPHRRSGSVFIWLLVARDKGTSRDVRRRFH
jgi:hypothetical protein